MLRWAVGLARSDDPTVAAAGHVALRELLVSDLLQLSDQRLVQAIADQMQSSLEAGSFGQRDVTEYEGEEQEVDHE
jgi:hypothetical protein